MQWCPKRVIQQLIVYTAICASGLLTACNPQTNLDKENLLRGARAETFILSHGALCARLPSAEAIDLYARNVLPQRSAVARDVRAWDLSGLLDIIKAQDGRWIVLPSQGLKKLKGIQFRKGPSGENDALCFGRLWIDAVVDYQKNKPLGLEDAVTARFNANLKDPEMIHFFKDLKVESFDPSVFVLSNGTQYASTLAPSFLIEIALHPTPTGWYLAKNRSVDN